MEDSLDAYISQSLIDSSSGNSAEYDKPNSLSSDLLLQLLLNTVGNGSDPTGSAATVDPSALSGMDVDEYTLAANSGAVSAGDSADSNSLLAAALYSALGPLPDIAEAAEHVSEGMHGADAMLVDASVAAAEAQNAQPATLSPAATTLARSQPKPSRVPPAPMPQKQTIQQQALSTAGKRSMPAAAAGAAQRPATKTTTAAPARVAATAPPSRASAPTAGLGSPDHDDCANEDDEDMEGIDMKNLSSKERRQLRNKISARNFRVRRKEYISNLEAEVRGHKEEADGLRKELLASKRDNAQLREEIQRLKQRLGAMNIGQPSSAAAPATVAAAHARPVAPAGLPKPPAKPVAAAPPSAPMIRFNPHKDIAQSAAKKTAAGSPATDGNWVAKNNRSGFIAVNTTMLPSAHTATADELLAEARRKQVVNALLDIDEPASRAHAPEHNAQIAATILSMASIIAELIFPQMALESSLALTPNATVLPAVPLAC
ncbi:hypothetical protein LPJ70_000961 [Coemansia sp. RSA 2708]|nr:hypothetical protein LPJ70_000961 [Coemansia sp. RSA 2708]